MESQQGERQRSTTRSCCWISEHCKWSDSALSVSFWSCFQSVLFISTLRQETSSTWCPAKYTRSEPIIICWKFEQVIYISATQRKTLRAQETGSGPLARIQHTWYIILTIFKRSWLTCNMPITTYKEGLFPHWLCFPTGWAWCSKLRCYPPLEK